MTLNYLETIVLDDWLQNFVVGGYYQDNYKISEDHSRQSSSNLMRSYQILGYWSMYCVHVLYLSIYLGEHLPSMYSLSVFKRVALS